MNETVILSFYDELFFESGENKKYCTTQNYPIKFIEQTKKSFLIGRPWFKYYL